MPSRVFVDTSFVLALINQRDQYHERAKALSFKFEESTLVTTGAGCLKIGNALAKDFRGEALAVIRLMRTSGRVELVELHESLLEKALEIYGKYGDKTWGLVDCISFVVMRERGLSEVLTFDNRLLGSRIHHPDELTTITARTRLRSWPDAFNESDSPSRDGLFIWHPPYSLSSAFRSQPAKFAPAS